MLSILKERLLLFEVINVTCKEAVAGLGESVMFCKLDWGLWVFTFRLQKYYVIKLGRPS